MTDPLAALAQRLFRALLASHGDSPAQISEQFEKKWGYVEESWLAVAREAMVATREQVAGWYQETFCPRHGVPGDETHAHGDCEPCNIAKAIKSAEKS